MITGTKGIPEPKDISFEDGRNSYIGSLQAWHKKYAAEQNELESIYLPDSFTEYSVNVWDEYSEEEGTFAYVEICEVPDRVCFDVLNHLLCYARSNLEVMSMGIRFEMEFYDSSVFYPKLVGNKDLENSLSKRWQMKIIGVSDDTLEVVIDYLKAAPSWFGKPIDIYSES